MANVKIGDLTDGAPVQAADEFAVARGASDTFKLAALDIKNYIESDDVSLAIPDCIVDGVGTDDNTYATFGAAITAGKVRILVTAGVTETADVTLSADTMVYYAQGTISLVQFGEYQLHTGGAKLGVIGSGISNSLGGTCGFSFSYTATGKSFLTGSGIVWGSNFSIQNDSTIANSTVGDGNQRFYVSNFRYEAPDVAGCDLQVGSWSYISNLSLRVGGAATIATSVLTLSSNVHISGLEVNNLPNATAITIPANSRIDGLLSYFNSGAFIIDNGGTLTNSNSDALLDLTINTTADDAVYEDVHVGTTGVIKSGGFDEGKLVRVRGDAFTSTDTGTPSKWVLTDCNFTGDVDVGGNQAVLNNVRCAGTTTLDGGYIRVTNGHFDSAIVDNGTANVFQNIYRDDLTAILYQPYLTSSSTSDAAYTANYGELVLADSSGGDQTVDIPSPTGLEGIQVGVKKKDALNTVTLDAGAALIDGSSTLDLTGDNEAAILTSDGTDWQIISRII